jgi:hypothetical protein
MIDFLSLSGSKIQIQFSPDGMFEIELFTPNQETELAALPLVKLIEESLRNWSSQDRPVELENYPKKARGISLFLGSFKGRWRNVIPRFASKPQVSA